jgi:hypothetical protein
MTRCFVYILNFNFIFNQFSTNQLESSFHFIDSSNFCSKFPFIWQCITVQLEWEIGGHFSLVFRSSRHSRINCVSDGKLPIIFQSSSRYQRYQNFPRDPSGAFESCEFPFEVSVQATDNAKSRDNFSKLFFMFFLLKLHKIHSIFISKALQLKQTSLPKI